MDGKNSRLRFDEAASNLGRFYTVLKSVPDSVKSQAHEIRLRAGRPVMISLPSADVFVAETGIVSNAEMPDALTAGRRDIEDAFRVICNSSVYSHQQEIKNGFVVLKGGHRAGICGTAVVESGRVVNLRDISSINLRIAREIKGAANETAAALEREGKIGGALIFGPPGCGKTTILRDLARQLSSGMLSSGRKRVAVVDERGEIAACYSGQPQNELGPCCDVLDGYPKGEGIMQAVRSLSPDIVICDEIGGGEDAAAIMESLNAGVAVIASAHAQSIKELLARPHIRELLQTGAFTKAVMLGGRNAPGVVKKVYGEGDLRDCPDNRDADGVYRVLGGGNDGFRKAFKARERA